MTKLKMHSPDTINANIARIAELFPNLRHRGEG